MKIMGRVVEGKSSCTQTRDLMTVLTNGGAPSNHLSQSKLHFRSL